MRLLATMGAAMMLAVVPVPTPAQAEVASADARGFILSASIKVVATPVNAYRMLIAPDRWWLAAHSYSGDAANLSFNPRAGGASAKN